MVTRDNQGRMVPSPLLVSPADRAAFIAALGQCGVVTYAAAELGLSTSTLYRARRQLPEFAAEWDGAAAAATRSRHAAEDWNPATREAFIEALAGAASPAQAAVAVGRSLIGAYRLRGRSAEFATRWTAAQECALDALEAAVAERAIGGVRRTVTRGNTTEDRIEFSDRLAIFLLKALRPEKFDRAAAAKAPAPAAPKLDRDELIARFKGLSRRFAREEAEAEAAAAEAAEAAADSAAPAAAQGEA